MDFVDTLITLGNDYFLYEQTNYKLDEFNKIICMF